MMTTRWVRALGVVTAAAAAACTSAPGVPGRPALPSAAAVAAVRVGTTESGHLTVQSVLLEEYVEAAILSEFAPADGDSQAIERMFEVQAVIARTYAVGHRGRHGRDGYDLCDRTHCQLFQPARRQTSRWAPEAAAAVRRTRGQLLWFGDAPALAVFHADCGGRTSSAADVWGGPPDPI